MRMVNIKHEFPANSSHRAELILKHSKTGRQWVSTSVVKGFMRMKFARFEEKPATTEATHDWNSPEPYRSARTYKQKQKRKMERRLARYAGKDNQGGRAEWDK